MSDVYVHALLCKNVPATFFELGQLVAGENDNARCAGYREACHC